MTHYFNPDAATTANIANRLDQVTHELAKHVIQKNKMNAAETRLNWIVSGQMIAIGALQGLLLNLANHRLRDHRPISVDDLIQEFLNELAQHTISTAVELTK